jgi:hypothetical protein
MYRSPVCRGSISGAKDMTDDELNGLWLADWIKELKAEQKAQQVAIAKQNK